SSFCQAEDGIRAFHVTGVQTCALPISGCTAIAGSTRIGRHCLIAGAVGISGHLQIADHVRINAMTLVSHSIHEAGEYAGAAPMQDAKSWRKNAARLRRLDALARRMLAVSKE